VQLAAGPPLAASYGLLAAALRGAGFQVSNYGWDWRRSVLDAGWDLSRKIPALFPGEAVAIVAHSAGGLVARAALKLLTAAGQGGAVRRVVTIGTPQFGSWFALQALSRYTPLYAALAAFHGRGNPRAPGPAVAVLDALLASWPCLFEILPWRNAGPLPGQLPPAAAAVYNVASYGSWQPYVTAARLAAAAGVQGWLADAGDVNRERAIIGYGVQTRASCTDPTRLADAASFSWTADGDGVVTREYATRPGLTIVGVPGDHFLLPVLPAVWGAVASLL
jgi:hypothetical protein